MVGDKGLVTRSGVARGRLATVDDTRIHDIAEQLAAAVAKQDTIVGPVSPQVIEAELAVAIRRGTGARLVQGSLLGTGKAIPCEIVGPCRRGIAADHDVARRSRGREVAELLAGAPGAAASYRGGAGAVERHGKGLQVAGPAGSIEGRLIDQSACRRTDDARLRRHPCDAVGRSTGAVEDIVERGQNLPRIALQIIGGRLSCCGGFLPDIVVGGTGIVLEGIAPGVVGRDGRRLRRLGIESPVLGGHEILVGGASGGVVI